MSAEAQAKAIDFNTELQRRRRVLNMDELASMAAPRARFEREFAIPGHQTCYFFSIDGVLNGRKIEGAIFAGECMLVQADNYFAAADLATRGLRATVEIAHEEYRTRELRGDDLSPTQRGLIHDAVAGRKGRVSAPGEELRSMPKLKAMIEHIIGGLPWKW